MGVKREAQSKINQKKWRERKKKWKIKVEGEPLQSLQRDTGTQRPSHLIVLKYSSELMDQFGEQQWSESLSLSRSVQNGNPR